MNLSHLQRVAFPRRVQSMRSRGTKLKSGRNLQQKETRDKYYNMKSMTSMEKKRKNKSLNFNKKARLGPKIRNDQLLLKLFTFYFLT